MSTDTEQPPLAVARLLRHSHARNTGATPQLLDSIELRRNEEGTRRIGEKTDRGRIAITTRIGMKNDRPVLSLGIEAQDGQPDNGRLELEIESATTATALLHGDLAVDLTVRGGARHGLKAIHRGTSPDAADCRVIKTADSAGEPGEEPPAAEGGDRSTAIRSGVGAGNAAAEGPGTITAERSGPGPGHALRTGAEAGAGGNARRSGSGEGNAQCHVDGPGHALRFGAGNGLALRTGKGEGDAVRAGAGNGDAARTGLGRGRARRCGHGNGSALSETGTAVRSGKGHGHATCACEGDGDAVRSGPGNGHATRERPRSKSAATGNAWRLGTGSGNATVRQGVEGDAIHASPGGEARNEHDSAHRWRGKTLAPDQAAGGEEGSPPAAVRQAVATAHFVTDALEQLRQETRKLADGERTAQEARQRLGFGGVLIDTLSESRVEIAGAGVGTDGRAHGVRLGWKDGRGLETHGISDVTLALAAAPRDVIQETLTGIRDAMRNAQRDEAGAGGRR